jgi:hypothetical protein
MDCTHRLLHKILCEWYWKHLLCVMINDLTEVLTGLELL